MTDDRLNDDIATQHKKELLWTDEDQRLAKIAMERDEDPERYEDPQDAKWDAIRQNELDDICAMEAQR